MAKTKLITPFYKDIEKRTIEHKFLSCLSFKILPSFKLLKHLSKSKLIYYDCAAKSFFNDRKTAC